MSLPSSEEGGWGVGGRRGNVVAALVLMLTGLFFAWRSWSLSFDNVGVPGPGLFPFVLGLALCLIAIGVAIETARTPVRSDAPALRLGHRDVVVAFAALVGVAIVFERLGAYATLGLFMVALLVMVARVSWLLAVAASAATVVTVWLVFQLALGLQLPAGPF